MVRRHHDATSISVCTSVVLRQLNNTKRCELTNLTEEFEAISTLEEANAAYGARSYVEARSKYERSRDLYLNLGDLAMVAVCDDGLGLVLARLGDFPESERAYVRARDHYVALGRFDKVAALDQYLASGHQQAGRLDESADSYLLARAYFADQNALEKVAICDRELARVYSEAGRDDEAVARLFARRNYLVYQNLGDEVAEVDLSIGKLFINTGNWDEAGARLQSSRAHYAVHAPVAVAACDLALGDLYRDRGEVPAAELHYTAARAVWAGVGFDMHVQNVDARLDALREQPAASPPD